MIIVVVVSSIIIGTMSRSLCMLLFFFAFFAFFAIAKSRSIQNLTFMFVTSFGRQSGFNASAVVPAADIALEDINSHPDVLQGYHLMYDEVRDSQVSVNNTCSQKSNVLRDWELIH